MLTGIIKRLGVIGIAALLGPPTAALAESPSPIPAASRPGVRVLIDISGSMKQNDPHYLRKPALEMLVQLYPKGSRGGVWQFAQGVDMLVPYQDVSDSWREAGRRKAARISAGGLFTNIPLALEKATADINRP